MRTGGSSVLLLVCLAFSTNVGAADQDSAGQRVERLAADAVVAYKAADYARTVELLEKAYQIRQVAALLYNLAKAYEKLGETEKAIDLYRRYSDSTDADPKLRMKAEARIAAYEEAHRGPRPADPGTELNSRLDATPDPRPDPKTVGGRPFENADDRALRLWRARRFRDRVLGLSLSGFGVACALSAVGLSVSASLIHDSYTSTIGLEADRRAQRDDGRHQAIAADVLYAVAVASVGVGGYFIWRGYHHELPPRARVTNITPYATSQSGGLSVGGAF